MNGSVYIVIINWNGWKDTIECLESIKNNIYNNYRIVLIDNGSKDNSLEKIKSWAAGKRIYNSIYEKCLCDEENVHLVEYDRCTAERGGIASVERELLNISLNKIFIIIKNNENLGFAVACNIGISYAIASGADYIWLLNNDTVIEKYSLLYLVNYLENEKNIKCVTGQIRYYYHPSVVWNCGGKITWYGTVKYYHANDTIQAISEICSRRVTFVTGCAALFKSSLFKEIGLLSDRFFFGEEDMELSLRMKNLGQKMACLYNAIIYHKVGATIGSLGKKESMPRIHIYYLNRFINMRNYMSIFVWHTWKFFYSVYIIPMSMLRYKLPLFLVLRMITNINRDAIRLNKLDKDKFEEYMGLK